MDVISPPISFSNSFFMLALFCAFFFNVWLTNVDLIRKWLHLTLLDYIYLGLSLVPTLAGRPSWIDSARLGSSADSKSDGLVPVRTGPGQGQGGGRGRGKVGAVLPGRVTSFVYLAKHREAGGEETAIVMIHHLFLLTWIEVGDRAAPNWRITAMIPIKKGKKGNKKVLRCLLLATARRIGTQ